MPIELDIIWKAFAPSFKSLPPSLNFINAGVTIPRATFKSFAPIMPIGNSKAARANAFAKVPIEFDIIWKDLAASFKSLPPSLNFKNAGVIIPRATFKSFAPTIPIGNRNAATTNPFANLLIEFDIISKDLAPSFKSLDLNSDILLKVPVIKSLNFVIAFLGTFLNKAKPVAKSFVPAPNNCNASPPSLNESETLPSPFFTLTAFPLGEPPFPAAICCKSFVCIFCSLIASNSPPLKPVSSELVTASIKRPSILDNSAPKLSLDERVAPTRVLNLLERDTCIFLSISVWTLRCPFPVATATVNASRDSADDSVAA